VHANATTNRAERWLPGVHALRTYQRSWLRADLVAGAVLAAILVPQGMAYAELAGLPAVTGLYTTIACLAGYAVFGPSRVLVLGPDSSISPLIFAAITPLLAGGGPDTAIALAGMLAVLVGLTEIGLGLRRLGFVADLLSKEVQVGYMNGLGITIIVGQLPKLFGFSTHADSFLAELRAFVDHLDQTHERALRDPIDLLPRLRQHRRRLEQNAQLPDRRGNTDREVRLDAPALAPIAVTA
jgi:MFS superfamily sulfate permease-like transporter